MIITIVNIQHEQQRYETVGDWQWDDGGNLTITVSDMGDWKYNFLVAFHELVEVMLCRARGIPQKEVDEFDIVYEAMRKDGDTSEPGDSPLAPYCKEHRTATNMERVMAEELEVVWEEYDEAVGNL